MIDEGLVSSWRLRKRSVTCVTSPSSSNENYKAPPHWCGNWGRTRCRCSDIIHSTNLGQHYSRAILCLGRYGGRRSVVVVVVVVIVVVVRSAGSEDVGDHTYTRFNRRWVDQKWWR